MDNNHWKQMETLKINVILKVTNYLIQTYYEALNLEINT